MKALLQRLRTVPKRLHWIFSNIDVRSLDVEQDADSILARVLERGRLADVRWAIETYGLRRIHRFFREVGDPEISERTRAFWRAVLKAKGEPWRSPPAWRQNSSAPWID